MVVYLQAAEIRGTKITVPPRFYSASGYGRKIPTGRMIQTTDKKWRRMYVCQISNAGTAYVLLKGDWRVIGPEAEISLGALDDANKG